jgi:hypothetical protein
VAKKHCGKEACDLLFRLILFLGVRRRVGDSQLSGLKQQKVTLLSEETRSNLDHTFHMNSFTALRVHFPTPPLSSSHPSSLSSLGALRRNEIVQWFTTHDCTQEGMQESVQKQAVHYLLFSDLLMFFERFHRIQENPPSMVMGVM